MSNLNLAKISMLIALLWSMSGLNVFAQILVTAPMTGTPAAGEYYGTQSIIVSPNFSFTATAGQSLHLYISNCVQLLSAPSVDRNFILTSIPRQAMQTADFTNKSVCDVMQTVQYFDGLGRPKQTIQIKGSPEVRDIVQPFFYDQYGRESVKYLPYSSTTVSSNGSYKATALTDQSSFYANPQASDAPGVVTIPVISGSSPAFSLTVFEPSPLNRVIEQGAPGASWQPNSTNIDLSHTNRVAYKTNDSTDINTISSTNKVMLYNVTIASDGKRTLVNAGTNAYATGQLYVTETKDENWQAGDGRFGVIQEFKDKEGRVVLKRFFNKKPNLTLEMLSTYYVYDEFGNLCYVLPPGALPDGGTISSTTMQHLCYQYRYDDRKRLVEKSLPGVGKVLMVYNSLDQVVMTQDAIQRKNDNQQWMVTKYDAFGRVVVTGLYTHTGSTGGQDYRTYMQGQVTSNSTLWEQRGTTGNGYTTADVYQAFPTTLGTILSVNYYDNYDIPGLSATGFDKHTETGMSIKTTGLLTASLIKVIDGTAGNTNMLWTVNYYDDEGRNIRSFAQHFKGGAVSLNNYDEINNTYSFNDELLTSNRVNYIDNGGTRQTSVTINMRYEYDHMGRKTNTWEAIGGNEVLLSQQVYNEIGQLIDKKLHSANQGSTFVQSIDYRYNPRGWLKSINNTALNNANPQVNDDTNDAFGEELSYDDYNVTSLKQFNGNISAVSWQGKQPSSQTLPQIPQSFEYNYDRINRLTLANYTTSASLGQYNEALTYDLMGNIKTLKRYKGDASNAMDNLLYTYENSNKSNRIFSVQDLSTNNQGQLSGTSSYISDDNGNLQSDNKKLLNYTYNYLNLPSTVTKTGDATISYVYDAAGRKLRKVITGGNRDYVGGIEYNSAGSIDFIQTEEGRARLNSSSYFYEYYLKDHLGNTRVMIGQDGIIGQQTDYYAFGMEMVRGANTIPSPDNKYKYNGKELQDELSLNQYDYGARFYDPVIGRWTKPDPLAEISRRWSPYGYGLNNPIRNIDVDGMLSTHTDEDGNVLAVYDDGDLGVYKHEANADGKQPTRHQIDKRHEKSKSAGGEKMGETKYWDEFENPDSHNPEGRINFGESFDSDIENTRVQADLMGMDLYDMGENSKLHQLFDFKNSNEIAPYGPMTGKLLNGKYATARSAGNYLAGYNGREGTIWGFHINFETYMKLAGALQQGHYNKWLAGLITVTGHPTYGPAPYYGEQDYTGRMVLQGWLNGGK
jgi:RHS repeat-associated protein